MDVCIHIPVWGLVVMVFLAALFVFVKYAGRYTQTEDRKSLIVSCLAFVVMGFSELYLYFWFAYSVGG